MVRAATTPTFLLRFPPRWESYASGVILRMCPLNRQEQLGPYLLEPLVTNGMRKKITVPVLPACLISQVLLTTSPPTIYKMPEDFTVQGPRLISFLSIALLAVHW